MLYIIPNQYQEPKIIPNPYCYLWDTIEPVSQKVQQDLTYLAGIRPDSESNNCPSSPRFRITETLDFVGDCSNTNTRLHEYLTTLSKREIANKNLYTNTSRKSRGCSCKIII